MKVYLINSLKAEIDRRHLQKVTSIDEEALAQILEEAFFTEAKSNKQNKPNH